MFFTSKSRDNVTFDEVLEKLSSYITDSEQLNIIKKAYEFALNKHDGQTRLSGDPFITHPLNTADILASVYADYETIAGGILHDVLSKSDCTVPELEDNFGRSITLLVQGVTKLNKIHFSTENDYLIDYYKKIIVGMSEDVRVIIIKLASSLHNMRTLWALDSAHQKEKAEEALDILAPLAHHIGIHKIKSELEDLALRYLKPDVFYDIAEKLNQTKIERDKTVYDMQMEVSSLLTEHNIKHEIKGRAKCIYSIYNKLSKGKKFSDIYDLLALRVLVDTEQDCYLALGIIHSRFRPYPRRFKDYIAMPKPNMYQSLHTTVFGIDGYLFEIQIRTYEMNEIAENGVASHWAYKENKGSNVKADLKNSTEVKLQFFKSVMDLPKDKISNEEFLDSFQSELLNNSIYVFTPKGDVIELPKGATPIDFAYRIHSRVGETMVGAIVNNNIVPLDYELQNNDIVKINTNKSSTPKKEWLKMAKSSQTRSKIKSFFTKNEREVYIERGKDSLEKELRRKKISISQFLSDENVNTICSELKTADLDEVYLVIGNGKYSPASVINIIYKESDVDVSKIIKPVTDNTDFDIVVSGIDNVRVNLASCCLPVFGDKIVGYITKGNGISIHRISCHNLEALEDRTVDVNWNEKGKNKYLTSVLVYSNSRENHMLDLMKSISNFNINIDGIKTMNKTGNIIYEVILYVNDVDTLNKFILTLNKNSFVEKVERTMR